MARSLGFSFIEIDTNGINLAKNQKLAKELADAGLSGAYFQFDGLNGKEYEVIRGANLVTTKKKAIENIQKAGLEIALAVTVVKGINDNQLWDIIKYAVEKKIRGVNFQTFSPVGRFPSELSNHMEKVTIPDVAKGIELQSSGELKMKDFIPVPCPDNRCSTLTYALIKNGKIHPITKLVDAEKLLDYYARIANFDEVLEATKGMLYNIWSCSPEKTKIEDLMSCCQPAYLWIPDGFISISCHSMQDIWNIDLARIKRCCMHELTIDGRLIPFCLYNILYRKSHKFHHRKETL